MVFFWVLYIISFREENKMASYELLFILNFWLLESSAMSWNRALS